MSDGQFFDPEEGVEPTADLEVGRYALRSFKFSVEGQSDEVGARLGWWTDGVARVFRPISYTQADGWLDGTCEAVCHAGGVVQRWGGGIVYDGRRAHQAPHEKCSCGIYGSLTYADLLKQFREARQLVTVFAAEGITVIGDRGLRTQFARVVAYWVDPALPYHRDVAQRQFVEATPFDCPNDMVESYGLPLLPPAQIEERRDGYQILGNGNFWTRGR